jgi:hypothetical protein
VNSLTVGGVTYTKAQLLTILGTSPGGDATYILIRQLIAAKLSVANGADDTTVAATIVQADAWLVAHPLGSNPSNPARAEGIGYATILESYNSGTLGPTHCGTIAPAAVTTTWSNNVLKVGDTLLSIVRSTLRSATQSVGR